MTDVTPVNERKRRLTQWDIKPPGYESVTSEQAKLSGMFPLPGAPRPQQAVDPSKLQAFMNPSKEGGSAPTVNTTLRPTNSRQSKRLVVQNIPPSATEESVVAFFNLQLNGLNVIESTDPCVGCQMSKDHTFAMLEFRHSSEATVALAFDGITMEADDHNGSSHGSPQGLKLQRPKDYIVPAVVDEMMPEPGVVSNVVVDTPNKISVANLPPSLDEEHVKELLSAFGQLKAFVLVQDPGTEESRVSLCNLIASAVTSANTLHRVSPLPSMPTQVSPMMQSAVSIPCRLRTDGSLSRRPASVSPRSLALKWASTPCPCLLARPLSSPTKLESSSSSTWSRQRS